MSHEGTTRGRLGLGALLLGGLLLIGSLAVAPAADAELWVVTLHSGAEFETLYQPKESAWDSEMVSFLSDAGNWVALPKDDIASVISETERLGFGKVIDNKTIQIGFLINDELTDEELAALEESGAQTPGVVDAIQALRGSQEDLSVEQFVSPGDAGDGGFPARSFDDF